jgi:uncharacterized pyridoxamine 5'-phosphate oxidase family protein
VLGQIQKPKTRMSMVGDQEESKVYIIPQQTKSTFPLLEPASLQSEVKRVKAKERYEP